MFKHKSIMVTAALVVVVCWGGVFPSRPAAQDRSVSQEDDATPIQEGVMTDSQHGHSKLYKGMGTMRIVDLQKRLGDNVFLDDTAPNRNSFRSPDTEAPLIASARRAVCGSDVIIVGSVTSKVSQLTEDGYYIFTDYTIHPSTYLKRTDNRANGTVSSIVLTEPGGKIRLNGLVASLLNGEHPRLEVGKKYLFILTTIPNSPDVQLAPGSWAVEYLANSGSSSDDITGSFASEDFSAGAQASRIKMLSSEPCSNGKGRN